MHDRTTQELLAAFVDTGAGPREAAGRAETLLREHGGLRGVFRAAADGASELEQLAVAAELCGRRLLERMVRGKSLSSPSEAVDYLRNTLSDLGREVFIALFLDTRHRVIRAERLFEGSIDGASVYPRVIAERALRLHAAAVIVAHNHPSGVAEPSLADQAITRRLKEALGVLEIRLLDHFIIGEGEPVSLASRGLI